MAVGFAGAGLLTLSQSLGIIFGANIGTTITGWLVALLGFKLSLTKIVMPLVFIGALMRLLGKKRVAASGYALAGFGLIFTGISILQTAMVGFSDVVTPESFPPNTFLGRFLLVLIGVAITLVTQSSSAGVATAITAVHVGTISLPQAAAMVIGMDVGTTFTAAMAAVGGTVNARRTGIAHVVYNMMTGLGAFLCLPLFIDGWDAMAPDTVRSDPEIALVSFHTLFNAIGVVVVLPFTGQFAKLIVRLVPAHEHELTRRLDPSLLNDATVAIDSVDATLRDLSQIVFGSLVSLLRGKARVAEIQSRLNELDEAIKETRIYLGQIETASDLPMAPRRASALHVADHLSRLVRRCRSQKNVDLVNSDQELSQIGQRLTGALTAASDTDDAARSRSALLEPVWIEIDARIEPYRREAIQRSADGRATIDETLASLDASRWLRRACYHSWRIAHHLDHEPVAISLDQDIQPAVEGEPEDVD